jgi:hypothetical protein
LPITQYRKGKRKKKQKSKKNVKFCSYRVWFSSVNYDVVDAVLVLLGNGDGEAGVVVALRGRKQRLPDRLHGALIARAHYNHVHTHTFQVRKKKPSQIASNHRYFFVIH